MAERHAKYSGQNKASRITSILVFLFVVQVILPLASSEGDEFDDMQICSNSQSALSVYLGGFCDPRNDAQDGTSGVTAWVEGMYHFNMTSPTEIQFQASWAIREWDRSGMGIFDGLGVALEYDNINSDDGLPADVLRASFDNNTDPSDSSSPTVEESLLGEIDGSISDFLSTWGGSSAPVTEWSTKISLPDDDGDITTVDCTINPSEDDDGNAFEPPICISTNVVISLPISSTYGLSGVNEESLNSALEGLLVMGSEVTTKFDVRVDSGHKGTYAIHPPDYATVLVAGGNDGKEVPAGNYNYGVWEIDNRDPSPDLAGQAMPGDLDMTLGFRNSGTTNIVSIGAQEKSLDLRVVIDMTDENNAFVEVVAGIYQIQSSSLDKWGVPPIMDKDKASVPFITSDGIRMAYHTGLLDLADLSENIPISNIGEGVSSFKDGLSIEMGAFQWTHVSQPPLDAGGLNYSHGTDCIRGVHYCLEGTAAMDDTYPVYMRSVSHTFPMGLGDLLGGNLGDAGFMNSVTGDDLGKLLNSGVEFSTALSEDTIDSFVGDMLPKGLSADLTMEIVLPYWASTSDGGDRIELDYRVSGNHEGEISLSGSDSFSWEHAICSTTTGTSCTDISQDVVCKSTMKSCVYANIGLDFTELSFASLPVSKGATVEFGLTIDLTVYRIAVPESMFESMTTESTSLELEVLPADLLRVILEIGARGEPLEYDFPLCDTGMSYCDQTIPLSIDNATGLPAYTTSLEEDVKMMITDRARDLTSESDGIFGTVDLSSVYLDVELPYDGLIDDDESIGDERGLSIGLSIPSVRVTAGVDNSWSELISWARGGGEDIGPKVGVLTEAGSNALVAPFLGPMITAMDGLTGALASSLVSAEGVKTPPNLIMAPVPASMLSGFGPEEVDLDIAGTITLTLPLGIELRNLTSEEGFVAANIDSDSQRQVITYKITQGMADDTLHFEVLLTPFWILSQIQYYLIGLIVFFLWRVRRRSVKRRRRRRAEQLEMMEEAVSSPTGYVPPTPTVEVLQVADNGIVVKRRLASL